MPVRAGKRLPFALSLLALLLLPVSCTPLATGLGGDPCLLAAYQGHTYSIIGHMNGEYSKLRGQLDALQTPQFTISSSQDISETLFDLSDFEDHLNEQMNLLNNGAKPPEGRPVKQAARQITAQFTLGARMLTQAYLDTQNDDMRAAQAIADAARQHFYRGGYYIEQANIALSRLQTYSPNC